MAASERVAQAAGDLPEDRRVQEKGATPGAAGPGHSGPTATSPATYEIRVAGHLDDHWAATLGDLALIRLNDGTTSLTGPSSTRHNYTVS